MKSIFNNDIKVLEDVPILYFFAISKRYIQLQGNKHVNEIVPYVSEQDLEDILRSFKIDVRIIGDFSNWTPISLSSQGGDDWQVTLKLSEGPHLIKFIVDEKFTLSEMMEKVIGPDQEVYNLVHAGTNNSQKYEIR